MNSFQTQTLSIQLNEFVTKRKFLDVQSKNMAIMKSVYAQKFTQSGMMTVKKRPLKLKVYRSKLMNYIPRITKILSIMDPLKLV